MLFFTWAFAAFFAVFYSLYLLLRRNVLHRNLLLLGAAYFFYGWWDVRFVSLLAFTTGLDYLTALGTDRRIVTRQQLLRSCGFLAGVAAIALAIHRFQQLALMTLPILAALVVYVTATLLLNRVEDEDRRSRYWVRLSVILNLSVLAFFKYFNFFGTTLDEALSGVGIHLGFVALKIILPLGISFHTFQSIGRTIDVRRGKLEPSTNFIEFATFLTYFPQILAGPIERANHMLPQFRQVLPITGPMVRFGATLFLWGLFKKIVIADNASAIANPIFHHPTGLSSGELLLGLLAFSFQIYCDFSGYTDMARGLAYLMGFELRLNFALPYFARTPSEFWRRWHISLSEWLRDYLYISLGGNRGAAWKTYRNLMLTMVLGGLWHGAAWTFIMWGFLHGLILVVYRVLGIDDRLERAQARGGGARIAANMLSWAILMPLICVTWAYFRADTMAQANAMLLGILHVHGLTQGPWGLLGFYIVPLFAVEAVMRLGGERVRLSSMPFLVRYTAILTLLLAIMTLTASSGQQFIYFDF